jgi:hypothetical protein
VRSPSAPPRRRREAEDHCDDEASSLSPLTVGEWSEPLPVDILHGTGPRRDATLREDGVHSVGLFAAVSAATVQRLLAGRAGRLAADLRAASAPGE